ncbi:MAG: IS30 family transposase, partial [Amaricoccus sp.]
MRQHYSHWTLDERCRLCGLLEMGLGVEEIVRRLNRHRSTVYREIARNGRIAGGYRPQGADDRAWARKRRGSRIARSTPLRTRVETGLAMEWSPEQIVGRMERGGAEHRTSVESIYRHVWSLEGRKACLPGLLRQRKRRRGRGRRRGRRLPIPNRVPIHARPEEAGLRSEIGHWEGDVMHFRKGAQALLTLEDRASRLTLARRLRGMEADRCARAIVAELLERALRSSGHESAGQKHPIRRGPCTGTPPNERAPGPQRRPTLAIDLGAVGLLQRVPSRR